jgi:polyisoprenoid-binding protein YceI
VRPGTCPRALFPARFDQPQKEPTLQLNAALFLAGAAIATSGFAAPESYTVDPAHTYPNFEVNHLGLSTARGMFTRTSGKIVLDRVARTGSIDITIETASLFTGHAKRDEHLRGEDFFNVGQFPTMTFKSKNPRYHKSVLNGAEGELTMLGVTRPVTLTLTGFHCGEHPIAKKPVCGANAIATIKRSDWGMTAYVPAIGDEVQLKIQIEAFKD